MSETPSVFYSTERPKLPAAFLEPQTCPPGRCRFPGTPLPPASPVILAAINKFFFAQFRREFGPRCYRLVKEKDWESHVELRIMELALAALSPDEITAKMESKEERERMGAAIRRTWSTDREIFHDWTTVRSGVVVASAAGSSDFIRIELARMMNGREYKIVVDGDKELLCLHDVLDPQNIEEWTALLDVHQIFPALEHAPQPKDREPLLRKINAQILEGNIAGPGWETSVLWRRRLKAASDRSYKMLGGLAVELFNERRFTAMITDAVEEMGSALPIFAHLLFRSTTDQLGTIMFLRASTVLQQLENFMSQVALSPLTHLASDFPELDGFLPQSIDPPSPLDTSLPPPSPTAPDKTFRRTKMVKNESETFWWIQKRVEPRCCAPDRCSGRTPATINDPVASDYARVESAVVQSFLGCFDLKLLALGGHRSDIIQRILRATSTLDCGTPEERFKLLALLESIAKDHLSHGDGEPLRVAGFDIVEDVFRMFHDLILSMFRRPTGESRFPCLCDLVDSGYLLEKVMSEIRRLVEGGKRCFREKQINVVGVRGWVVGKLQSGELRGSCWRGESWREKITPFLRFVEENLNALDIGAEGTLALYERYRELFRVAGSSRILEIAHESSMQDPTPEFSVRFLLNMIGNSFEDGQFTSPRQNAYKILGDEALVEDPEMPIIALDYYKTSTLVSPVGSWSARLNSAAVRLRMANTGSQFYQYSMAIQDCTMALYYCPPKFKFKAYYRRGFGLARLQLWKKAILDFEQALLIEPQNVLIKQELAAVKRMLKR